MANYEVVNLRINKVFVYIAKCIGNPMDNSLSGYNIMKILTLIYDKKIFLLVLIQCST